MSLPLDVGSARDDPVAYSAAVRPNAVALHELATGRRLTYAELDRRVAAAAAQLRARLPAEVGQRVVALGRNSLEQVVLAMACQRADAIFVPLSWRLAESELRALVGDCTPALIMHDAEFATTATRLAGSAARLTFEEFSRAATDLAASPTPGSSPAALLYTSGTTGRPKGVIVTRANALFAALNFALVGEVGPQSVVLADLPMFHTIGLVAVTRTTLLMGGALVVSDRFTPERTLAALTDETLGVTHYFGVPQIAAALRAEPGFTGASLSRLHALFVGGAPLPRSLLEAYLADGVPVVNGYGMSEAGTVIHMPIDAAAIRRHPDCIGRPAPFVDVRIVDGKGRDVADDEVGELWLRGSAVTPGYWQKPAETAAAFVDGWFRTGDLVSRAPDGFLRLVDRLKEMYISGGENVYPAEVEAALLAHPAVADAAVLGMPDARWGEVGVALVVRRPGAVGEAELRAHALSRLARYKCPARFVFVEALPRTPAGKLQKHLLRDSLHFPYEESQK